MPGVPAAFLSQHGSGRRFGLASQVRPLVGDRDGRGSRLFRRCHAGDGYTAAVRAQLEPTALPLMGMASRGLHTAISLTVRARGTRWPKLRGTPLAAGG